MAEYFEFRCSCYVWRKLEYRWWFPKKFFFFFSQKKDIAIYRSKCFVVFLENFYFAFIYLFL